MDTGQVTDTENRQRQMSPTSSRKPSQGEVEDAVRTIIRWMGDDPMRSDLLETPSRVARAYQEHSRGYSQDPADILSKTFEEIEGYDEAITLRGIHFQSLCAHHMAPMTGRAWISYIPRQGRIVGISKLARLVDVYSNRLQLQETMTAQIANTIENILEPRGVAVMLKAEHNCMTCRGVRKMGADLVTCKMLGVFQENALKRQEFLHAAYHR